MSGSYRPPLSIKWTHFEAHGKLPKCRRDGSSVVYASAARVCQISLTLSNEIVKLFALHHRPTANSVRYRSINYTPIRPRLGHVLTHRQPLWNAEHDHRLTPVASRVVRTRLWTDRLLMDTIHLKIVKRCIFLHSKHI